jgi:hypothetical protein
LLETEGSGITEDALPFATKKNLQSSLDNLKEDIQNWLGMMHKSMLNAAAQQKADHNQLEEISRQMSQAAGMAGDSIAAFAKRALLGRCASCDALIIADPNKIARPVPVGGLQGQWPPRAYPGAKDSIRPPECKTLTLPPPKVGSTGTANTRLPQITNNAESLRQFPMRKIKKGQASSSSPELRGFVPHQDEALQLEA